MPAGRIDKGNRRAYTFTRKGKGVFNSYALKAFYSLIA